MKLETSYLGLALRNPLVASAGPVTQSITGIRQLADAGVGAVVLPSLFEEEIRDQADQNAAWSEAGMESFPEALTYFPSDAGVEPTPHQYLSLVERAAATVDIPLIASLNCVSAGSWAQYARALEQAGAAAIELNVYYVPSSPVISGREVEQRHVDVLETVKAAVSVPVAVKLSPYFSSLGELAVRLDQAGADGLVLFNRFLQPDIDPEALTVTAGIGLSAPAEGRMPRAWIALLAGQVRASLAASTGVENTADVAAYLLAGADVVMTTSSLLRHGPRHAMELLRGLVEWMARKGFTSIDEVRGRLASPAALGETARERADYVRALRSADRGGGSWQR